MPARKRLDFYGLCIRLDWRPSTLNEHIEQHWLPAPSWAGKRMFWFEDAIDQWEAAGFPRPSEQEKDKCLQK